jgi:hypothetical protein
MGDRLWKHARRSSRRGIEEKVVKLRHYIQTMFIIVRNRCNVGSGQHVILASPVV